MRKKTGRPSGYTEKIADDICEWIACGKSLRAYCETQGNPSMSMVLRWLAANESFRARYARAREVQADTLADEILHIANTPQLGVVVTERSTGTETRHADMIEHRRLQVDARKWLAAKMVPQKYGDRQKLEHSGPDGGEIVVKWLPAS